MGQNIHSNYDLIKRRRIGINYFRAHERDAWEKTGRLKNNMHTARKSVPIHYLNILDQI